MNYIGSKLKLSSWIKEEVEKVVSPDLSDKIFCDIFAGTGIIGRTFKPHVKKVISNDLEDYSFVLNKNYIVNSTCMEDKERYIKELDALPLCENGFIYQNYCMGSGSEIRGESRRPDSNRGPLHYEYQPRTCDWSYVNEAPLRLREPYRLSCPLDLSASS